MKVAVLHQSQEPPMVNGIRKPMKPNGYKDSSADIAYCLKENKIDIVTPTNNPDLFDDNDWSFPDTDEGILSAMDQGADVIWLNTVLYKEHPITHFSGIEVVGQAPFDVEQYDDKFYTNKILKENKMPVVDDVLVKVVDDYKGAYPCVLKPIRGRGSQGVCVCNTYEELKENLAKSIEMKIYGDCMMVEPFLSGQEITVSVFPNGMVLPPVGRRNHENGIAPYNGKVAVSKNSFVIEQKTQALAMICDACSKAVTTLNLKALCRIDCRMDSDGYYKMFDFNLKPNMTGAARPHRLDQDSLTMIAASGIGWTYGDLIRHILNTKWKL